jgi:amino acid transporter
MLLGGFRDVHRRYTPHICVWLLTATTASMFPLLQKDLLAIPTLALSAFFLILCNFCELGPIL